MQTGSDFSVNHVPPAFKAALIRCAVALLAGMGLIYVVRFIAPNSSAITSLSFYFFENQDETLSLFVTGLLFMLAFTPAPLGLAERFLGLLRRPRVIVALMAVFMVVGGIVGRDAVFSAFALSRDEILPDFEAKTIQSGRLIAPVAPEWRPYTPALAPTFMLPVAEGKGFISDYLPGNAALRAFVGLFVNTGWTNPILAALSVLLVYAIAGLLWPGQTGVALVATLLVATSSQTLVMAMTPYAMPGHLALNLLWLYLFLLDRKSTHFLAALVGFVACGLHQLIFHPMFVAPFILSLFFRKRRGLFVYYCAVYALILLFWINYAQIALSLSGMSMIGRGSSGASYFLDKVLFVLSEFSFGGLTYICMNLIRFFVWQNPLLVPLALLAAPFVRKEMGVARSLALGIVMTLGAVSILVPYQGHSWGYRYLHGLIGSFALLGGYGWLWAKENAAPQMGAMRSALMVASLFACLFLWPAQWRLAYDFARHSVNTMAAIQASSFDLVIVDPKVEPFGQDYVRNDPFLTNRPKILALTGLNAKLLDNLCGKYSIALFAREKDPAEPFSDEYASDPEDKHQRAVLRDIKARHCAETVDFKRK